MPNHSGNRACDLFNTSTQAQTNATNIIYSFDQLKLSPPPPPHA